MAKYPAVIQIRNSSSRFPGKAMKLVLGRPIVEYLLERVKAVPCINRIIIATTINPADNNLAEYCQQWGAEVFRGDENNVLDRIYRSVKQVKDKYFIKFWGDSPLMDPALSEDIIRQFEEKFTGYDYVSNNHPSTYPEGMQIEIISKAALEKSLHSKTLTPADKEHVTSYLWRHPEIFKVGNIEYKTNIQPEYRIVIDYPEDFEQMTKIIEALYPVNPLFSMEDMIKYIDQHPEIKRINLKHYESEQAYYQRVKILPEKKDGKK